MHSKKSSWRDSNWERLKGKKQSRNYNQTKESSTVTFFLILIFCVVITTFRIHIHAIFLEKKQPSLHSFYKLILWKCVTDPHSKRLWLFMLVSLRFTSWWNGRGWSIEDQARHIHQLKRDHDYNEIKACPNNPLHVSFTKSKQTVTE